MRLALRLVRAAVLAASALLALHAPRSLMVAPLWAAERPGNLQGTWTLNKDLGADPLVDLETRQPRRPMGAGGTSAPGTGTGLGGPLIGGRRAADRAWQDELARVKEMLRLTMAAPVHISITIDGPRFEVRGEDGTVQRMVADGKKWRDTTNYPGLELERKTKWSDGVLVTEFRLKDSEAKGKQTWTREGNRLKVETKVEPPSGAEPLEVLRVYEFDPNRQ